MLNFSGKTVLVTGVTRGIGSAIAKAFLDQGARVIGTGTAVANENLSYDYFQADFTEIDQVLACADFVREKNPDILINNAGINKNSPFLEIDLAIFQEIYQVNVIAPLLLCQAAIPGMKEKRWGRIVNISSIWGKISKENRASYSASKFALDGLTVALAAEYSRYGILTNCVAPGFTNTEMTEKALGKTGINEILKSVPIGRFASPDEIANLVLWLSSNENSYIAGQNIAIDGGFTRV
jgi:3-oxoacyl-[acyl-carrier protein] reductase